MQKLNGIQWLRAIAAILVVAFHAAGKWHNSFLIGEAGVDIFFIISGFIMWSVADLRSSPLDFMRDRIARIVPIYWLAIGLMAVGGVAGLFPNAIVTPLRVVQSLLFIPYVSDGVHVWPLLVQGWTLNYEMFFYALFACLIPLPKTVRLASLVTLLFVIVVAGLIFSLESAAFIFLTDPIILEFAAGALLGQYFTSKTIDRRLAIAMLALGIAILTVEGLNFPHAPRVLALGVPALLIVSGTIAIEKSGIRFGAGSLVFLGDASYSVYLFHTFAISLVAHLIHGSMHGIAPVLGTIMGVAAGCLVYTWLEKPIARKLKRKKQPSDAIKVAHAVLGH